MSLSGGSWRRAMLGGFNVAPGEADPVSREGATLREYLGRAVVSAGWAGLVGVLLLVAGAALLVQAGATQEAGRAQLEREQARLLRDDGDRGAPKADTRAQLQAYYDRFPPASDLPARLRRVGEIALAHGIRLQRTDYRSGTAAVGPLISVALTIPVNAPFPDLYRWLAAVLAEMPEVALHSLQVRRTSSASVLVEADVRLLVFLKVRP